MFNTFYSTIINSCVFLLQLQSGYRGYDYDITVMTTTRHHITMATQLRVILCEQVNTDLGDFSRSVGVDVVLSALHLVDGIIYSRLPWKRRK